ncbi:mevalonate kinase [Candidatus Micrarchaeota archaeon]|nr:mevalonate kinase [Candidatus Micrarchaeota archaeon]
MAEAGGKIILYGEHFVVHGAPAIAAGISNKSVVKIKKAGENSIVTEQKVVPETSVVSIQNILDSMAIKDKYKVHLEGNLPTYGGLGSSAAFCVALVKAIAEDHDLGLNREQINRHAYEGEKAFHGDPSGIDNTVAAYGGIVEFRKDHGFSFFEPGIPLNFIVSFTGKYSPTAKMVGMVGTLRQQNKDKFGQLMDEYTELSIRAKKALEKGQADVIGVCMNENQVLLSELGVSDETNDEITIIALEHGALGSKLTGGGGGGCCISLADDEKQAKKIAEEISNRGYESFITKIEK